MLLKEVVELSLPDDYWVEAELGDVRERGGHCYMELIQKDERTATPIAKAAARCWRGSWGPVSAHFERTTGQMLRAGLKVLVKVHAQFHENYGFSWIVTDIDPVYTMGDMARKRQEILRQLAADGVLDLNKQLALPLFAQRIAVVSSAEAAGYGDFCDQLHNNAYGLAFTTTLFAAIMQGERVEQSVIAALDRICGRLDDFDCVVIIRGGGATSDLSGFDTLALAENVANFPLPIITGIGHERDESVLDIVAHSKAKTPTAAAELLVAHVAQTYHIVLTAQQRVATAARHLLMAQRTHMTRLEERIPSLAALVTSRKGAVLDTLARRLLMGARSIVDRQTHRLESISNRLPSLAATRLLRERHRLELLTQRASMLDPQLLLNRGYSITTLNGRCVTNASELRPGDRLTTRLATGTIESTVTAASAPNAKGSDGPNTKDIDALNAKGSDNPCGEQHKRK